MQPPRPADPPTAEDSPGGSAHVFVSRDIAETQAWLNALLRRDLRLEPLGVDGFEARLSAQSLAGAHIIRAEYPAGMRLKHGGATDDLTIRIVAAGGSLFSAGRQTLAAVPGRGLVLNTSLCESAEYGRGSVHTTFTLPGEEVARILQAAGLVLRDVSGNPIRMVGINFDITSARLADQALRANEAKLRTLFELSPVGIALNDFAT
ncbi:MAG: hypothetical protein ACOVOI_01210, partial [Hyphomicrobiales bacterium]